MIMIANQSHSPKWLTDVFLDDLAAEETNGREIKTVVQTARAIARDAERGMHFDDLLRSLDALKRFISEFGK